MIAAGSPPMPAYDGPLRDEDKHKAPGTWQPSEAEKKQLEAWGKELDKKRAEQQAEEDGRWKDFERRMPEFWGLLERGCNLKSATACLRLGTSHVEFLTTKSGDAFNVRRRTLDDAYPDQAIESFEKSCDYGLEEGCNKLAEAYVYHIKNFPKAAQIYMRQCDTVSEFACRDFAQLLVPSKPGVQSISLAQATEIKLMADKNCETSSKRSCLFLIFAYLLGEAPYEVNGAKAMRLAETGCKNGDNMFCLTQGIMLVPDLWQNAKFKSPIKPDRKRGMAIIKKACAAEAKIADSGFKRICPLILAPKKT
jgi:TPR repeat protein